MQIFEEIKILKISATNGRVGISFGLVTSLENVF